MSQLVEDYGELFENPEDLDEIFRNPVMLVNLLGSLIQQIGATTSAMVLMDHIKEHNEKARKTNMDGDGGIASFELGGRQWTAVKAESPLDARYKVDDYVLNHPDGAEAPQIRSINGEILVFFPPQE